MRSEAAMAVSYVIPAYNCAATLDQAVDSIFDGNLTEGDEIIIVNDASTDETKKVAEELVSRYAPNVRLLNNEQNRGCPASRNIGIRESKNQLIFNLDSDNILERNSVQLLTQRIVSEGADVAAFQECRYFKQSISKVTHRWVCNEGIMTLADFLSGVINAGPGGNFLYRKDTWKRIGGYWEYGKGLHEAWGFSLKMLIQGAKFYVVPDTHYFHRYSHNSLYVRENARKNEGVLVTNKFIESALPFLDNLSQVYVRSNPNWFDTLGSRPLSVRDGTKGKNGKIRFASPIKQVVHSIRQLLV